MKDDLEMIVGVLRRSKEEMKHSLFLKINELDAIPKMELCNLQKYRLKYLGDSFKG